MTPMDNPRRIFQRQRPANPFSGPVSCRAGWYADLNRIAGHSGRQLGRPRPTWQYFSRHNFDA
jgi:hypothetical protein